MPRIHVAIQETDGSFAIKEENLTGFSPPRILKQNRLSRGEANMDTSCQRYRDYLQILREELVPAMGCTEPIALAYGAAVARETLGTLPETITVWVSGNLIKNVKSVIVPPHRRIAGHSCRRGSWAGGRTSRQKAGSNRCGYR